MKRALATLVVFLTAAAALAGPKPGIPAREKPGDYPVSQQKGQVSMGAMQLSREQIRNSFSSDLERGYVVVEVGVFPAAGSDLEVHWDDFALRVAGTKILLRPASPATIAGVLQKKNRRAGSRDVDVYPTVGVGYSTGGTDPYGNRYPGGWSTSAGVGVGVGSTGPAPASSDADRATMKSELQDKILPEGTTNAPAGGYLYFPLPEKQAGAYELEYRSGDARLVLALPRPK